MNTVEFYQQLKQSYDLLAVHVCAEFEGEIVRGCLWCQRVYGVLPADGAPGGLSHGYCSDECLRLAMRAARGECCEDARADGLCCRDTEVADDHG